MHPRYALIAVAAAATAASADIISLPAAHDATLYQDQFGSLASGAGEHLFAGETADNRLRRSVMSFDLAAAIPAGATINSVSLTMYMDRTRVGSVNVDLHAVTSSWTEGPSNPGSPGGAGAQALPGDVTWIHRTYDTVFWNNEGGDFSSALLSTTSVGGSNGYYTWATSASFVAAAQSWLNAPGGNFGLIVIGDETQMSAKRFASRENATSAFRPKLVVDYTPVPAPGAALVLAIAGLMAQKRRRR